MISVAPSKALPQTVFSIAFTEAEEERWVKENIIIDMLQWTTPRSKASSSRSEANKAGFEVGSP